jgi:hypothetical protein
MREWLLQFPPSDTVVMWDVESGETVPVGGAIHGDGAVELVPNEDEDQSDHAPDCLCDPCASTPGTYAWKLCYNAD